MDGGKSWRLGDIRRAGKPNSYGKHWAWVHWSIRIPMRESLSAVCLATLHACTIMSV